MSAWLAEITQRSAKGPLSVPVRLRTSSLAHAVAALIGLLDQPTVIAAQLIGAEAPKAGGAK